ncbi:hypothetical protein ABI59_18185 [Acidobacteria bacterium Mor1]|nr:hypothetical protein ABI59_18185 [Acidobacteria bacterium Mor1]
MNDLASYLERFEELRSHKRWSTDVTVLRFAAMSLIASPLERPHVDLERVADALRDHAGWFSPLRSSIRYAVAAMILRNGLEPAAVHRSVEQVREGFRARKMRRGGIYEVLAGVVLAIHQRGEQVPDRTIDRTRDILDHWKRDHRFLTGSDDYPMAAMHATRETPVHEVAVEVEKAYEQLRAARFSRGNPLQLASHLLALSPRRAFRAANRFITIAGALRSLGYRVSSRSYDEISILALTSLAPRQAATRVLKLRDRLREAKPRPSADIAFTLASSLVLAGDLEKQQNAADAADVAALRSIQAVLDAQQAAVTAVIAATAASSAAASAAS